MVEHIFIQCPSTRTLWNDKELYLSQKLNRTFMFTISEKMFGVLDEDTALDHILKLRRKHNHFITQKEPKPNIHDLEGCTARIIQLEKYSAKISHALDYFKTK